MVYIVLYQLSATCCYTVGLSVHSVVSTVLTLVVVKHTREHTLDTSHSYSVVVTVYSLVVTVYSVVVIVYSVNREVLHNGQ